MLPLAQSVSVIQCLYAMQVFEVLDKEVLEEAQRQGLVACYCIQQGQEVCLSQITIVCLSSAGEEPANTADFARGGYTDCNSLYDLSCCCYVCIKAVHI